ncbi:zinc finger BED domain-containing protein 4 [Oreochromis niloticus]|uniref:zinc finger BED domain-containing protein 4 n=1 Tax=Oreochromis niloticus TaxID=8128 RepID=UPI000DF113E9|nr:zinc finger BED domain-containing protein 4-like [Oreochromis niloticus]
MEVQQAVAIQHYSQRKACSSAAADGTAHLETYQRDLTPLTADECDIVRETLLVVAPFHQATVELSEERRVSESKVILMMKMLYCALERNSLHLHTQAATHLHDQLRRRVTDTASNLESLSVLTLSTLLDPRFKTLGFRSSSKCSEAVNRLKVECAAVIARTTSEPQPGPSSEQSPVPENLWQWLDEEVGRQTNNATADSIIEVQRYLAERSIPRSEDPLTYWGNRRTSYPNLFHLALQFVYPSFICAL